MLSQDSEDEIRSRFVFELAIWLWQDELNPRVRCAFGNVCCLLLIAHLLEQVKEALVVSDLLSGVQQGVGFLLGEGVGAPDDDVGGDDHSDGHVQQEIGVIVKSK